MLIAVLLDIVVSLEHRVGEYFGERTGSAFKILGYATAFLILFTSKFVILEVVDFVFGDLVDLGHFLDILVLVVTMMGARAIVGKIYDALGTTDTSGP